MLKWPDISAGDICNFAVLWCDVLRTQRTEYHVPIVRASAV